MRQLGEQLGLPWDPGEDTMIVYKIEADDGKEYWTDDPGQVCAALQLRAGWVRISRVEMKRKAYRARPATVESWRFFRELVSA